MNSNFNKLYIDGLWTQWLSIESKNTQNGVPLLSSILIFIFIPFMFSLFIYVFTIHLRIYYSLLRITYSLLRIYYYIFTIHFTMHYALCTIYTYSLFYMYSYIFTISRDEIPLFRYLRVALDA